jgi:hypothetical protein
MTCQHSQTPTSAVVQVYAAIWKSYIALAMMPVAYWMLASSSLTTPASDPTAPDQPRD